MKTHLRLDLRHSKADDPGITEREEDKQPQGIGD
jgi:hypothetical protein